ncbi:hypothetical protein FHY04_004110 [Sphingomonas sp. BK481]|nr:hypothetical protein [Sphingomonas sp. BK481]
MSSMVFEAFKNVLNDFKNSGILERRPPPRRAALHLVEQRQPLSANAALVKNRQDQSPSQEGSFRQY